MEETAAARRMYHMEIRREDNEKRIPFDVLAESEEAAKAQLPRNFVFVRFTEVFAWPEISELEV